MKYALALLFFIILPTVIAIGISPPSAQLDFVPGKTYELSMRVINYNDFPINVITEADNSILQFDIKEPLKAPANGAVIVPVRVTLPNDIKPGYTSAALSFIESFEEEVSGSFAARTAVLIYITVWRPYPGSYAEITAFAPSVGQGNNTKLTTRITNLGTDAIENGKVTIKVLSPDDELKNIFTYTQLNIAGNSNYEMSDVIPSRTYAPGRYILDAKLDYNTNVSTMTSDFIVGTQDIDILAAEGPIYLDKAVNKFNIHIQSLWNLPLDNVYAVFQLGSTKTTTPSVKLQPFEKTSLQGYWETDKTVQPGMTNAYVTLYYDGGKKETLLPIQVYNETPAPIGAVVQNPTTIVLSAPDLIFIVLAILIVVAIIIFAFERHTKQKPTPPQLPQ